MLLVESSANIQTTGEQVASMSNLLYTTSLAWLTTFLIRPSSSKFFRTSRATDPLIFILSTSVATVMRRYDWTSLWSFSEVALSRTTVWLALSLTVRKMCVSEYSETTSRLCRPRICHVLFGSVRLCERDLSCACRILLAPQSIFVILLALVTDP